MNQFYAGLAALVLGSSHAAAQMTLSQKLASVDISIEHHKNGCLGLYQDKLADRLAQFSGGLIVSKALEGYLRNPSITSSFMDGVAFTVDDHNNWVHDVILEGDFRAKGVESLNYSANCILAYHSKKSELSFGPLEPLFHSHGYTFNAKHTSNGTWYFGSKDALM